MSWELAVYPILIPAIPQLSLSPYSHDKGVKDGLDWFSIVIKAEVEKLQHSDCSLRRTMKAKFMTPLPAGQYSEGRPRVYDRDSEGESLYV